MLKKRRSSSEIIVLDVHSRSSQQYVHCKTTTTLVEAVL